MILEETSALLLENSEENWWVPFDGGLPNQPSVEERVQWVAEVKDLPDPTPFMIVTDPEDHRWVSLDGHYEWEEPTPPEDDKYELDRCSPWLQLQSYLVGISEFDDFVNWASKQDWMGNWMPRSGTVHDTFIGEYPWHRAANEAQKDWETSWRKEMPSPVVASSSDYVWESGGFDCSIKETIRGSVPSSFLVDKMKLHWNGEEFVYVNSGGKIVA